MKDDPAGQPEGGAPGPGSPSEGPPGSGPSDAGSDTTSFVRWAILSVTTLGSFMVAFDSNVISIALPIIGREFTSGISLVGWITTSYIVVVASLLLFAGKMADAYGKKRALLLGYALFGAASALCVVSQSVYELIGFRVLQSVGAAFIGSSSAPIIFESFPVRQRGTAMGVNSIAWAVGSVSGPVLGGFLVEVDWRLIFLINVPVAAGSILVGRRIIPKALDRVRPGRGLSLNPISSVLLAVTISTLLIWLTFFETAFLIIGLAALAAFVLYERRDKHPLVDRELQRNRGFVYTAIALMMTEVATGAVVFILSFYFQVVRGFTPVLTGIYIATIPIVLLITGPLAGRLFDRLKTPALIPFVGTIIAGAGMVALGVAVGGTISDVFIPAILVIVGLGMGVIWTPILASALRFVVSDLRGAANGTAFTLAYVGTAVGIAISVAVSASSLPRSVASQIYLNGFASLTPLESRLFGQGLSEAILALGLVNLASTFVLYLVVLEQRKFYPGTQT